MRPFYFGESAAPIYGVSHEPQGDQYRTSSILICNSVGHEYIRSHGCLRQLADLLSRQGYYVLRFDYRGSGDSAGSFEALDLANCCEDVEMASEELKALSGQQRVITIGVRVGAMISALSARNTKFVKQIMWDPVLIGADFVNNLKQLQMELLSSNYYYLKPRSKADSGANEFLGYRYGENFISDLSAADLFNSDRLSCPVDIISSRNDDVTEKFANHVQGRVSSNVVKDMVNWRDLLSIESALTVNNINKHIVKLVG